MLKARHALARENQGMKERSRSKFAGAVCACGRRHLAHVLAVALGCGSMASHAADLPIPCAAGSCGPGAAGFVQSGQANYVTAGNVGTITQQSERAILNWREFNVGAASTVNFNQPTATSAALNRIHQADPSRILGRLNANGQVYLINQNGIVFGAGAQVNTSALVASTLDVSDDVFRTLGITGAINDGNSVVESRAAFEGTSQGDVTVEKGARIRAGERVMLIGSNVTNAGTVETPDGQAILAASEDKVYIAADGELRGLLVEVDTGGEVTNLGDIVSERGNTTLVGLAVNQAGRIRATTSVNVNGSIRLLARDRANPSSFTENNGQRKPVATRAGTLTFAEGSVTEVAVSSSANELAVDGQPQSLSTVEAVGRTVRLESDSTIRVPGGNVSIRATSEPAAAGNDPDAKIYMDAGALIDVAGDRSAVVAMERNQGSLKLFGNELADAPVQRDGPLARQEIHVDLRVGTPLTDITKLRDEIKRTAGERLSAGGTVSLQAEGDVILQQGSNIDFSGGEVHYLPGMITTTQLQSRGRVVDIGQADPGEIYDGIVGTYTASSNKWGVSRTWTTAGTTWHPGYVEGKDAGTLSISAGGGVALNGTLRGDTVRGTWQRDPAATNVSGVARPFTQVPLGGALQIVRGGNPLGSSVLFSSVAQPQSFSFEGGIPDNVPTVLLPSLFAPGGINRFSVTTPGRIEMPENVSLELDAGGELVLNAADVKLDGDIRITSGKVSITKLRAGSQQREGALAVGGTALIDVSGRWVNDLPDANGGSAGTSPLFVRGGSVTLAAEGDLVLAAGSEIAADAGAQLHVDGEVTYGAAGAITLSSRIPNSSEQTALELGGNVHAFGFDQGGSLKLEAAGFRIGARGPEELLPPTPGVLELQSSFFTNGGFGNYQLIADRDSIEIRENTSILLQPLTRQLRPDYVKQGTGANVAGFSDLVLLPEYLRGASSFSATVSRAPGVDDELGRIRIGEGARIETEIGGSIALSADTRLDIDGTLEARAGSIDLALRRPSSANEHGFLDTQAIRLGETSRLNVSGAFRSYVDTNGFLRGEVLDAGTVDVHADRGYILSNSGSRIDISGVSGKLDLPSGAGLERTTVYGNAGSLSFRSAEGGFLNGDYIAHSGGGPAADGSLRLTLDAFPRDPEFAVPPNPGLPQFPVGRREIVLAENVIGNFPPDAAIPGFANGRLFISPGAIGRSGFDSVDLVAAPLLTQSGTIVTPSAIVMDGNVSLNAERHIGLDAGVIDSTGGRAQISSAHVSIGPSQQTHRVRPFTPVAGTGQLLVDAGHIDLIGDVSLSGFAGGGEQPGVALKSAGDIRMTGVRFQGDTALTLSGALTAAGDISLQAARIYPSTVSSYAIRSTGEEGRIRVEQNGTSPGTPLSAAGALTLSAANIEQNGTLYAPFGSITLDATNSVKLGAGSLTSVSGAGAIVPFGFNEFGQTWVYPLAADLLRVLEAAPEKNISLSAPDVVIGAGSKVDVSGGGDLLTYEFIKGPGGTRDILLGDNPEGSFAIVPTLGTAYGVFDPVESSLAGIEAGSTIYLAGGRGGLPAGTYARLPARYALLPGAFLVTPVDGTQDISPATSQFLPDGRTALVAGKLGYAGTGIADTRWSGYAVETNAQVRKRAEYNVSLASTFFNHDDLALPADAGRLAIGATRSVEIAGTLASAAESGARGAQVDFVADHLAVVHERTGSSERVELVDTELGNFGAASILLGGSRRRGDEEDVEDVAIAVDAQSVVLESGSELAASEVLLVARDEVRIAEGASVVGAGAVDSHAPEKYTLQGNGAFVRASTSVHADVERSGASGQTGTVVVEEGGSVRGSGSINLEASRDVVSAGELATPGSLSLTASLITLGDAPSGTQGLMLSTADLARIRARELRLNSRSTIDFVSPLTASLESLRLDAGALRGMEGLSGDVSLTAGEIVLSNHAGASAGTAGLGSGSLLLSGGTVRMDGGDVELSGFGTADIAGGSQIVASEAGSLRVRGDLSLAAPLITADSGVDFALTADGGLTTIATAGAPEPPRAAGLGASLSFSAQTIDHAGRVELPSGLLTFRATDELTLRDGSILDASGRDIPFGDRVVGSSGGAVSLQSEAGSITIGNGAQLIVSAGSRGGDAGRIDISARNGTVRIADSAVLSASAASGNRQGQFILSGQSLETSFSALNAQLNAGGFTSRRDFELGTGDIAIGADDVLLADELNVSANGGSILLAGHIRAASEQGGQFRLAALKDLQLLGNARIDGRSAGRGHEGGQVEVSTVDGLISIAPTAAIDVSGTDANGNTIAGGSVYLRAPRIGANNVGIASLAGSSITGAKRVDIEAFRAYDASTVDFDLLSTMAADTDAYMANAASMLAGLGVASDSRVHFRAGEEVRSDGDLTLASSVDLFGRRYGGEGGSLTLRAAGDLLVDNSISDGLAQQEIVPFYPRDVVQTGESWRLRLVAGAALDGADVLGTNRGAGDIVIGNDVMVRTGTADIDVAAGGDLRFAGNGSLYTVGENRGTGILDAEAAEVTLRGDFVEGGGDVRIDVAGNIRGVTTQFLPDFMPRAAGVFEFYRPGENFPLSWAIDASKFRQGIGALGGGNVSIRAGGDVESLTVALPTNLQPLASDGTAHDMAGGGSMRVEAGGSILGGNFLLGQGTGVLRADGAIGAAASGAAPVLQVGDGTLSLHGRHNVGVGTVFNPTIAEPDPLQGLSDFFFFPQAVYAFGYTERSALQMTSIAGNVEIAADPSMVTAGATDRFVQNVASLRIYPGSISARSLSGDVVVSGHVDLFPSARGEYELLAAKDVTAGSEFADLWQSDADVSLFPSIERPAIASFSEPELRSLLASHASSPVHLDDPAPAVVIANEGDIGTDGANRLSLSIAKQARLFAGRDVSNLSLTVQHNGLNDATVLEAGRDILYTSSRSASGNLIIRSSSIDIAGPGTVDLIAGRDVDFGTSDGLRTRGNLANPALADGGAGVNIWTGMETPPDFAAFIKKYLEDGQTYAARLASYLTRVGAPAGGSDVERFRALDEVHQRSFLLEVFFNELRESGVEATTTEDFTRGFAAIKTLFPAEKYDGSLKSFLSQITTLDGGDINLVVPGGVVNAGVASAGSLSKTADKLGIIVQREGSLNAFVKSDFLVNASRAFALDGGDIMIWSSEGNIDAGRGAKSALSIPPPTVTFDAQGNAVVDFPPAVSGSGIRTAVSTRGRKPGDVFLFAPQGVVNAGDAGIESAGNITVAAERVIGADNITFGGTSVGVPVDTGGLGASLAGVSSTASSATNAAEGLANAGPAQEEKAPLAEAVLGWLDVFIEGFGAESCKPDDEACLRRNREQ